MEREIKLVALPGEGLQPAVVHEAAARAMTLVPPVETVLLEAHYHDDALGRLRAGRWSLRARRENDRIVATAKGPSRWTEGGPARPEIECGIAAFPEVGSPLPAALSAALQAEGLPHAAWPDLAFSTRVERTRVVVRLEDGSPAELVVDRGEVRAGERRHPVCELELEALGGEPAALIAAAIGLGRDLPVRPGGRSKGARGLQMLGRLSPPALPDPTDAPGLWSRFVDLEEHLRDGRDDLLGHYRRVAEALSQALGIPELGEHRDPRPDLDSRDHAALLWRCFAAMARSSPESTAIEGLGS